MSETKQGSSTKRIFGIAGAFVAWVIGSGFATGQEILQFFTSYGYASYGVVIINLIGFLVLGPMLLGTGFEHREEVGFDHFRYFCGPKLGAFYSWLIPVTLVLVMAVLISGAGATLSEYYGLNHYAGAALMAVMPTQPLAISVTAILFIGFLMLSPAYSQFLFFAGWAKEFRQINMTAGLQEETSDNKTAALPPDLADTGLSPREEQVVRLLLKGMTVRQAAPELGLTTSTVSTYCKSAYKKLGINSRAELFLMFGRTAPKDDEK